MAFRWRADDGPTVNAGLVAEIFQGIQAYIARKSYIFLIFRGGGGFGPPVPPSGSAHRWPVLSAICYLDPLCPHKKTLPELDPLLQNFLDPRMKHKTKPNGNWKCTANNFKTNA